MTDSRRPEELLPKAVAERLLARASELDANSATITELRAAAVEAGISAHAFDAALAEVQQAKAVETPAPPMVRRRTVLRLGAAAAAVLAVFLAFAMVIVPSRQPVPAPGMTPFSLTPACISAEQAASVARPLLDPSGTVEAHGSSLRIVGTNAQIQHIQSAIEAYERSTAACAVPASKGTTTKYRP